MRPYNRNALSVEAAMVSALLRFTPQNRLGIVLEKVPHYNNFGVGEGKLFVWKMEMNANIDMHVGGGD